MGNNGKVRAELYGEPEYCVVCRSTIEGKRKARNATTCSPECNTIHRAIKRSKQDQHECRYCGKPSTPAQRKLYARWFRFALRGARAATLLRSIAADLPETDKRRRQLEPLIVLLQTQWDATRDLPEDAKSEAEMSEE